MSTQLIEKLRSLVTDGGLSRSGLARAAGLHANTLRDLDQPDWNPTAETLRKLEAYLFASDDSPALVPIEEIIEEARNGRMFILVDDEDRENEGDLVIPAQMATPDAINFMATHGRGLVCLTLTKKRVEELGLELMSRANGTRHETAFTTSIEAREGVTTGISAGDRARTVSVAIDSSKGRDDIVTPGHVFPLIARDGGVLVRAGHTEAAVDISRLAGLNPSGVICEIMKDDGTMARMLGTAGPWGAFLDSTLDRISDAAVICAFIYFYVNNNGGNSQLAVIAGTVALVMSLMTSYARAKAESLDAKCTVGIAERAERNLLIWIALLVSGLVTDVMPYALTLLAVLSTITVIQRMMFVRKQLVSNA